MANIKFAWRSDQYNARYAYDGVEPGRQYPTGHTLSADAAALGGTILEFTTYSSALIWNARENFTQDGKFSLLLRVKPNFSNYLGYRNNWIWFGMNGEAPEFGIRQGSGIIESTMRGPAYNIELNGANVGSFSPTLSTYYDLFVAYNGTDTLDYFVDGSTIGSRSPATGFSGYQTDMISQIILGRIAGNVLAPNGAYINEIVLWDDVVDPTSVNLVNPSSGVTSAAQSLNGNSRTGWVDVAAQDLTYWTSITAAQIQSGVEQIQAGLTQTGALGSSTDPGVGNVRAGTGYDINGVSLTGTLSVPTPASGTANTVDLNNILENIQYALEQANTTTASPLDLSTNLTTRVQNIVKFDPSFIEPTRDKIPAIHCWIEDKTVNFLDIVKNQTNGRREAVIEIKVAGFVAMDTLETRDENQAEEECRYLMESVERVLRAYDTFSDSVDRQQIKDTIYFSMPYSEDVTFKAGVTTIEAKKVY